jgi:ADP-heptose:LPS heptosyltransferase
LFSGEGYPGLREFLEPFDVVVAWCVDEDGLLSRYLESLAVPFLQNRPFPDESKGVHAADHLMRTLAPLGLNGPTPYPELRMPAESHDLASKLLFEESLEPHRFLTIHPGSGSRRKNWSSDKFAELIGAARKGGLGVLVLEGEADRDSVRRLRLETSESLPVVKELDLMTLAALLTRSRAYVGNDSGVSHLAAALNILTFALFGPTRAAVWAPRGPRARVLPFSTNPNVLWRAIQKVSSL